MHGRLYGCGIFLRESVMNFCGLDINTVNFSVCTKLQNADTLKVRAQ